MFPIPQIQKQEPSRPSMEFRATKEGFLVAEETQMLSRGKHHYPFSSSTPSKRFTVLEERSFFRCSEAPIMEQNNEQLDESDNNVAVPVEKEHMFDKVVTPSDVGKLNRLVIPKQHAERYFPLDSSGNEKGLLLNFEDGSGKSWRFRYSYWNSSQSYVITKGWSRFVKEKRLDAGDIVSFQRGIGESNKHRLFIDWRRRRPVPNSHQEQPFVPMMNTNHGLLSVPHHQHYLFRGSGSSWAHPNLPRVSSGSIINSYRGGSHYGNSMFYGGDGSMLKKPMIIESVPVVQGKQKKKGESKRLRLFGVNMECPNTESDESCIANIQPPYLLHHLHNRGNSSILGTEVLDKGKSSLSFDLGF